MGPAGRPTPPPAPARAPNLHDALDVAVSLGEVHGAQTGGALSVLHMRAEHGPGALPLPTDHAAHRGGLGAAHGQRPGGPGTPTTPASGLPLPRLLPPGLGTLRAPLPGRATWRLLQRRLGSLTGPRAPHGA